MGSEGNRERPVGSGVKHEMGVGIRFAASNKYISVEIKVIILFPTKFRAIVFDHLVDLFPDCVFDSGPRMFIEDRKRSLSKRCSLLCVGMPFFFKACSLVCNTKLLCLLCLECVVLNPAGIELVNY